MLSAVERKIEQFVSELDSKEISELYKKLPHGKRLRSKLILKIAGPSLTAVKTAAIVEMIHAASLLHDDVIDDAFTRRSKPSINAVYGNKTAIMFGDILYSKGFYELNNISTEVSKIISDAVVKLSIGELMDVSMSKVFNADRDAYMDMIYKKTASLIEASSGAAAVLAGKNKEPYLKYGKNLGIGFQMIDDILDITADAKTLGKPALHDYVEGKTTLPYIYLHNALESEEKKKLELMHGRLLKKEEQEWIMMNIKKYKILPKCYSEAKVLIEEAITLMQSNGEEALAGIAKEMIEREY